MPVPERDHDLRDKEKIMADIYSVRQTSDNAGAAITAAYVGANALKFQNVNGLGARTVIVKVAKTDMTHSELNTIINGITRAGGDGTGTDADGEDAFVVAGFGTATGAAFVSGTTDVVFLALQGTGTITADGSDAYGVTGAVTTIEAVFQDK